MRGGMRPLSPRLAAKKAVILAAKASSSTCLTITVADMKNAVEKFNAKINNGQPGVPWPPPPQSLSFITRMVDSFVSMPPTAEFDGYKKSMIPSNVFTDVQNFIRKLDNDTNNGKLETSTASFTLTQSDAQKIFENGIHYKYLLTFLIDNFEGVAAGIPSGSSNEAFVVLLRLLVAKLTPLIRGIKYNKSFESSFTIQVADIIEFLDLSTEGQGEGARNMVAEMIRTLVAEYIIPLKNASPKTSNGVNIQKIFDDILGVLQALNAWTRPLDLSLATSPVKSFTISLSDGKEFYKAIKSFLPPIPNNMLPPFGMFSLTTISRVEKLNILTLGFSYLISGGLMFSRKPTTPPRFTSILYNFEAFAHNMVGLS